MGYNQLDQRFTADLHQAVRQYHSDGLGEAALAQSLNLVPARLRHGTLPDTPLHRAAAVREILLECLKALKEQGQTEASWILTERFVAGQTAVYVAQKLAMSEATFYSRQADALNALAAILWQQEQAESAKAQLQARFAARKLPAPTYTHLFGVDELLTRLADALADGSGRWLIALDGLGGVGKTALAREAAERTLTNGQLADLVWETAQRERFAWGRRQEVAVPALTFEMLLDAIASQLGHPDIRRQPFNRKKADIRFLLDEASYLIVVDNLETAVDFQAIVDELWFLANPGKILLTSRYRLTQYEQVHAIHVDTLSDGDAVAFMRYHGAERGIPEVAEATEETLLSIQEVTAGNPLAIRLVVGQADRRPLTKVLADLRTATGDATELYTFIYRYAWEMLSNAGRALLLNMPHLPPGGGAWDDLLAVGGLPEFELASAVDELVGMSLLNVGRQEERRYSIHQLTRHFVLSELVQS